MSVEKDRPADGRRYVEPGSLSARERIRDSVLRPARRVPRHLAVVRDPGALPAVLVDRARSGETAASAPVPAAPAAPAPVALPPDPR